MAVVRYIVKDVGISIEFYTAVLDFKLGERYGDAFAIVQRGDLTLWLAGPQASASRPMPDGRQPEPGGWNRLVIEVEDLAAFLAKLNANRAVFRNEILSGPGGQQILLEDPSGNPIELFRAK